MATDISALVVQIDVQGAESAPRQIATVADAADRAEGSFGRLSAGASALANRLLALGAVGALVQQFGAAARAAGDFDNAISEVATVTGLSGPRLEALRGQILALSQGTSFAATAVSGAFAQIAADGDGLAETPAQIAAITDAAITLAEATRTQLPDAADALSQVLRQFQAGSDDAGRFIDVLVELGPTSDELAETVQALGAVGPVAAQAGLSIEETAGALALLARAGIEGAEAGTGLRQVLVDLEGQADTRLRPSIVGLEQALRNADEAQLGFSARQAAVGSLLTQNADELVRAADGFRETGAASAAAANAAASLDQTMARAAVALENARAAAGDRLTPAMIGLAQASAGVLTTFTALDQLGDPFEDVDGPRLGLLEGSIRGVGAAASLSMILMSRLGLAVEEYGAKLGALAQGPVGFLDRLEEIDRAVEERRRQLDQLSVDALDQAQGLPSGRARLTPEVDAADLPAAPALDFDLRVAVEGDGSADRAVETEVAKTEQILQEYARRYAGTEEQIQLAAEAEIVELTQLRTFTVSQETQRSELILAARQKMEVDLSEVRAQAHEEELADSREMAIALLEANAMYAETEALADELRFDARLIRLQAHLADVLGSEEAAAQEIQKIRDAYAAEAATKQAQAEDRAEAEERRASQERIRLASDTIGGLANLIGSGSEKAFRARKLAAIAEAAMNIPETASHAYREGVKMGGPYLGAAFAAAAVAAQVGNLAAIQSTEIGGGGGGYSSGGSFGGGSFSSPSAGRTFSEDAGEGPDRDTRLASERFPSFPVAGGPPVAPAPVPAVPVILPTLPDSRPNVSVEVVNNSGSAVEPANVEVTQNGDETMIRLFIGAVAQDIVQDGVTAQALRQRFVMNGQLGVRG